MILLFFIGSGCAALIYEVVWFQLLELTIGSSAISIAVLLATYMGGMCVGSLALARFIPAERHPLGVYGVIELGIGACALAVLWLLPYAGGLYISIGAAGTRGLLLRGLLSAFCLLPPTILMGATLPAVSRWIERSPRGPSQMGFLYAGNTLGSVLGCLLAGFYLLRQHDMYFATYVALSINILVGGSALLLSRAAVYGKAAARRTRDVSVTSPASWPVLVTIGLSGFTALSAEVVWTRLLSLKLGATVYTYSLILAAILLGIAVGSYLGSLLARSSTDPRTLLGVCQAMLVAGIAWSAYLLTAVLPLRGDDALLSASAMVAFRHDLMISLWTVLPAALLWGAAFPLALAAVARRDKDPGLSVGAVYAANTAGAILGSLWTPLIGMAWLGSQRIQQMLILTVATSSLVMLLPFGTPRKKRTPPTLRYAALVAIPLVLTVTLVGSVPAVPGPLVGYGPGSFAWQPAYGFFTYVAEGMNSSVAISQFTNGVLNYHNAGKVQASSDPKDLRLQRMLGHLTTLQQDDPESVLVIGCGSGATAGAVSIDPRVKDLTIVEIEPLVPETAQIYFADFNEGVVGDPKTDVVIDDGRHYLMASDRRYDAITCDPFDPWTKGAATLSTREFYESVREHLDPGGTVTVWVPLYQTRAETVKSEIATFMSVFPNAVVWDNVTNGAGDIVLSGRAGDTPIDLDAVEERTGGVEYERVRRSLAAIGFDSVSELFATYGAQGSDMAPWLQGAEINRDRNLRLQYLAGEGYVFDDDEAALIYQEMTSERSWPGSLFEGSPERLGAVRRGAGL